MQLNSLIALSPIDGRYWSKVSDLAPYFSEFGLIKYRVFVEVQYLKFLQDKGFFTWPTAALPAQLDHMCASFSESDAEKIKQIEKTTNHDVKAVEYFIKEFLEQNNGQAILEWVHFGLTSQDINNTSVPLSWKDGLSNTFYPLIDEVVLQLQNQAKAWAHISMLAKTHGQPASPTVLGKEWMVFVERLNNQLTQLKSIPYTVKFGGATGNYNAHNVAYPQYDWVAMGNEFVSEYLGVQRQQFTTQIEHYDMLAAQFDTLKRINTILIDFARDVWTYISMDYFKQKVNANEVGSSAMPHKVNPIDFENAEGNLGIANAILEHLSAKLPISRLQRDLTDSTVLRNIGVPLAHMHIALHSLLKGLGKLVLNEQAIAADLEKNWAVIAEAIQTVLRREQYPQPYEALKQLTRGNAHINEQVMHQFIEGLAVSDAIKAELKAIRPENYIGVQPTY